MAWRRGRPKKTLDKAKLATQTWAVSRRIYVNQLKHQPCMDCHNTFPPECMDFDHVRGTKLKGVSQIKRVDLLKAEIAKCELVCANCHRIRTKARRMKDAPLDPKL